MLRILFIGGWGRSGSTLLARMLGQVPGFFPAGEVREIWQIGCIENRPCGCGEPFDRCPFWTEVGERAFGGWTSAGVRRLRSLRLSLDRPWSVPALLSRGRLPVLDEPIRAYTSALGSLYRAVAEVSGAGWIIDGSKLPSHAMLLRRLEGVDLRVVHLVRDSRATVFSWQKRVPNPTSDGRALYLHTYRAAPASVRWVVYNELTRSLRSLGLPYVRLRYEDVVRDPGTSLGSVLELVDSDSGEWRPGPSTAGTIHLDTHHMVDGNPARFGTGPVEVRLDDEWTRAMSPRDRLVVTALTFPILSRYGYRPTPSGGGPAS